MNHVSTPTRSSEDGLMLGEMLSMLRSASLGLSLGKSNFAIRALRDSGLVKASNFQRSHRRLSYAYVLTPSSLAAKVQMTSRFLERKGAEFKVLQKMICSLRDELLQSGESTKSVETPARKGRS